LGLAHWRGGAKVGTGQGEGAWGGGAAVPTGRSAQVGVED
jgi:hypothetical protein